MTNHFRKSFVIPFLMAALLSGCSEPAAPSGGSANENGAQTAPAPQNGTPLSGSEGNSSATPIQVQQLPPQPAANAPDSNGKPAAGKPDSQAATGTSAPSLIVPVRKIDFGNQKKEKTLARSFVIKNGGKSELRIESVEPS